MKIINPLKKTNVVLRQLHHFHSRFESAIQLRAKLIEHFKEQVPDSVTFEAGFYEGQRHAKMWIVSNDDLTAMYQKYPRGEITLWCEGRSEEDVNERKKRKREETTVTTKRQEKEEEVDDIFKQLQEKHGDNNKYDIPKLRLWSRMMASNLHDSLDDPPNVPAFSGSTPKKSRQQSFSDAISGAAVAFAKALSKSPRATVNECSSRIEEAKHASPRTVVELRMKNFKQLRDLRGLLDDETLSESEYMEQKQAILTSLRKL